jgi:hypothetical protein
MVTRGQGALFAAFLVFAFLSAFTVISCVDTGFHIRTGAHILETGRFPTTNTFSFAQAEHPWYLHQAWPGVAMYALWRAGGVAGLVVTQALLAALIMGLALRWAQRESGPAAGRAPYWAATVTVLLAHTRFLMRPYLLSAVAFAALGLGDSRWGRRRWWQWGVVPALMAVWANTHVEVLCGFVLLGALAAGDWLDRRDGRALLDRAAGFLLALLAASLAMLWLNPHGPRVILVPIRYAGDPFWRGIIMELNPLVWRYHKPFHIVAAVALLLQAAAWRRARWRLILPALAFGYMAVRSQRSVLTFALALTPWLAFLLRDAGERLRALPHVLRVTILPTAWLAVALGVFFPDPTHRFGVGYYPGYYPLGLYAFMKEQVPPQRVFNDMRYGGGMLWWLYPDFPPFIDSRGESYSNGSAVGGRLAYALEASPEWARVAFDDYTQLFLQRTPENAAVVERFAFRLLNPLDLGLSDVTPRTAAAALTEAERALGIAPDCFYAKTAKAKALLLSGDYAAAADAYGELMQRGRMRTGADYRRDHGYALFMAGRWPEARAVFDRMIEAGGGGGFPFYMKHHIALAAGDQAQARRLLDQALTREPDNADYQAALRALPPSEEIR